MAMGSALEPCVMANIRFNIDIATGVARLRDPKKQMRDGER
jgi:hypothetical protein